MLIGALIGFLIASYLCGFYEAYWQCYAVLRRYGATRRRAFYVAVVPKSLGDLKEDLKALPFMPLIFVALLISAYRGTLHKHRAAVLMQIVEQVLLPRKGFETEILVLNAEAHRLYALE